MTTIWINGEWCDATTAKVSVFDHGLLYGDGVFEGIRVYNGRIFRLEEHVERLYDSARAILLEIPMPPEKFCAIVEEGVRRSGLTEAYIRPLVTRGFGDLGIDPRKCPKPTVIVIVDSIRVWPAERDEQGLVMVTAATPIPHREALSPRVKSLNYLTHIIGQDRGELRRGRRSPDARQRRPHGRRVGAEPLRRPPRQAPDPQLYARLSVYVGGFTLEAAETVYCNAENKFDLLEGLTALVDNSLLRQEETPDGESRFSMLEIIRAYAVERLAESG